MPSKRRSPAAFLTDITVEDDGLPTRTAGHAWSRDKLGILASYLAAFGTAAKTSPGRYFVDGMAGPGLYRFKRDGSYVLGSTLIGLQSLPPLTTCIAMEKNPRLVKALEARCEPFGGRAIIRKGDCNKDLVPALRELLPSRGATLVLLDPEGYALDFATVTGVSELRRPKRVEQLILVDTGSLIRTMRGRLESERNGTVGPWRFDYAVPFDWRDMALRYEEGDASAGKLAEEAATRFCDALKSRLGYKHAFPRAITRESPGQSAVYHLAFATDDDTGARIMRDVFKSMWSNVPSAPPPPPLPPWEQGRLL